MRDETRYLHPAVQEAAGLIREALGAGEDAAVVGADNFATWAAAHLALGLGSEVGEWRAAPYLIEVSGSIAEREPMLGNIALWTYMVGVSLTGEKKTSVTAERAIEAKLCEYDKGDFGAEYAARAMRASGTRVVLWLIGDSFARQEEPPGAARLIESMTGPLGAVGIRSILCFEGLAANGWAPQVTCPVGARPVHVARYGSPLDVAGAVRAAGACSDDVAHVKALIRVVAAAHGKEARGVIGDVEAEQLCDASVGCARTLIEWTKLAVLQGGVGTLLEWGDFERNMPPAGMQRALLVCAESAERMVSAMRENHRMRARDLGKTACGRAEWLRKVVAKLSRN